MRILISGSSGLVGTTLCQYLESHGHEIFKLPRDKTPILQDFYENMDAVINLSGENIASGRWTEEKKKKILNSRVQSTTALCQILMRLKHPPKVLVNASAIGYYGDKADEHLTEESSAGTNFLAQVCKEWESATQILSQTSIRVVLLRTGAVLTSKGGALAKMLMPFKLGLGGVIGTGKQYFSFIDLDDLIRIILFAIENESIKGPINAVTPYPVTNRDFTATLGNILHRPTFFSVPAFAARLVFGQMAEEVLLASQKVYPKRLQEFGFNFNYPTIKDTLNHSLRQNSI